MTLCLGARTVDHRYFGIPIEPTIGAMKIAFRTALATFSGQARNGNLNPMSFPVGGGGLAPGYITVGWESYTNFGGETLYPVRPTEIASYATMLSSKIGTSPFGFHNVCNILENGCAPPIGHLYCDYVPYIVRKKRDLSEEPINNTTLPNKPTNDTTALSDKYSDPNIATGIYPVGNGTTFPNHIPKPSNAGSRLSSPLCKRAEDVRGLEMLRCAGADTLLSGKSFVSGFKLFSVTGHVAYLESDGNLCLYDRDGKNYWCWNHGKVVKNGSLRFESNGDMCLYPKGKPSVICMSEQYGPKYIGPATYDWRLTLQGDGNFVAYNGNGKPLWDSATNNGKGGNRQACY